MAQPVKWKCYTDDASFSLLHITPPNWMQCGLNFVNGKIELQEKQWNSFQRGITLSTTQCYEEVHVSQGDTLATCVFIKPLQTTDVMDPWYEKYRNLDISLNISGSGDETEYEQTRRSDTCSDDVESFQQTFHGVGQDPYVLHVTLDTIVVHEGMLNKPATPIAYVNPKMDSENKVPPIDLIGELLLRETLVISTTVKGGLILVVLTNEDIRDMEIEDIHISYTQCTSPGFTVPFSLEKGSRTNVVFKTDIETDDIVDKTMVLIKWHLKSPPVKGKSLWSTFVVKNDPL